MDLETVGTAPDGGAVHRVVLGRAPGVVLEVLTLGATAHRLEVAGGDGVRRNVVLGLASVQERLASPDYLGGTIGRVASRIASGRFELDGVPVQVPTHDRGHALHGGPRGFDKRRWDVVDGDADHVVLRLVSPAGEMGFPGTLTVDVTYVVDGGTVRVEHRATTDATTPVNLTNHAYLNLDGEGAGSVDDHLLTVPASHYTPVDDLDIPTGGLAPVDGTPLDLRRATRLGPAVRDPHPLLAAQRGIDHNLVIDPADDSADDLSHGQADRDGLRRVAVLESPRSRSRLELWSDQPCLQVYTGNKLDGTTAGTSGGRYRQGDGVALEPQAYPDAVNRPEFPSVLVAPGQTYASTFEWRFGTTA